MLKALGILFVSIIFYSACDNSGDVANKDPKDGLEGTITISGAFALYPVAVKWGEEFKKIHPNVKFEISAGGTGKGISDALAGLVDLGAVSRNLKAEEKNNGAFPVAVTKDAVVGVFNSGNPNAAEILRKGFSKENLSGIFSSGTITDWKQAGFSISSPVHAYTRADACGAGETWAKYFGLAQEDLKGTGVFGDPGLLQSVLGDKDGIGYNNIAFVYDAETKKPLEGIHVVPIDINGNGIIDSDENFYGSLDQLMNAIASGKYPSPPARNLYFVSKNAPVKKEVIAFLDWVLTDGQKYVSESGYVKLTDEQLTTEKNKLH
jgi:phosphate transport system substrate-binding protein